MVKVIKTKLQDVKLVETDVFGDHRGFLLKHIQEISLKKLELILISTKIIIHFQ